MGLLPIKIYNPIATAIDVGKSVGNTVGKTGGVVGGAVDWLEDPNGKPVARTSGVSGATPSYAQPGYINPNTPGVSGKAPAYTQPQWKPTSTVQTSSSPSIRSTEGASSTPNYSFDPSTEVPIIIPPSSPAAPGGGGPVTPQPVVAPVDTRTQTQKETDFYTALTKATNAAKAGDPTQLKNFDKLMGITNRNPAEYTADFYVGTGIDAKLAKSSLPPEMKTIVKNWYLNVDKNDDGKIAKSELASTGQQVYAGELKDGIVSVDEAIAYHEKRAAGISAQLKNSGLSEAKKNEIRNYFLVRDADNNGYVTKDEVGIASNWGTAIDKGIIADGKYTVQESVNYHRGLAGLPPIDEAGKPIGGAAPPATAQNTSKNENVKKVVAFNAPTESQVKANDGVSPNSQNNDSDKFWRGGSIDDAIHKEFGDIEGKGGFVNAVEAQDRLGDNIKLPNNIVSDGKVTERELAVFMRDEVAAGRLEFTRNGEISKSESAERASSGIVDKKDSEAMAVATADRQSAKEARLKKIMEMRKPYMSGAASVNSSSDAMVVPPIVPASQVPPPPFGGR